MTLQEAYNKTMEIDGRYASVDESMQTVDEGKLTTYTVRCGEMFTHSFVSFEACFAEIAQMDPAKAKADKVADLKSQIAELEA